MAKNKKKRKLEKNIKKQIDVLWLVLFVMILIIFISVLNKDAGLEIEAKGLEKEAKNILIELTHNEEYGFAQDDVIHEEKLEKVLGMAYAELKDNLDIENDFCVYFEDENGNLIEVKDGVTSIGSSAIELNGEPCGK